MNKNSKRLRVVLTVLLLFSALTIFNCTPEGLDGAQRVCDFKESTDGKALVNNNGIEPVALFEDQVSSRL